MEEGGGNPPPKWLMFLVSKNAKLGTENPTFWENLGAKLKFWAPISPLFDICSVVTIEIVNTI